MFQHFCFHKIVNILRFLLPLFAVASAVVEVPVCTDPLFAPTQVCRDIGEIADILSQLNGASVFADSLLVGRLAELAQLDPVASIPDLVNRATEWVHAAQLAVATETCNALHADIQQLEIHRVKVQENLQQVVAESQMASDHRARFAELEAILQFQEVSDLPDEATRFDEVFASAIARLAAVPPERIAWAKWQAIACVSDMKAAGVTDSELAVLLRRVIPRPRFDENALTRERADLMLQMTAVEGDVHRGRVLLARIENLAEPLRALLVDSEVTFV